VNYLKHYCALMKKAASRQLPKGYTEKHHVFPVSIYGKNRRIVVLTAREHYIAHALLEKACLKRYGAKHNKTIKMTFAHCCMKANGQYVNSTLYEAARIRRNENMKGKALNIEFTPERREAIRQRRLGQKASAETRQKMSAARKGKKMPPKSEETLRRMSEAQKGKPSPMKGKKHSEESKEKMRQALKANPPTFTKERRQSISRRTKKAWKNGVFATEEYRQKLSSSLCKKEYELCSPGGEIFRIQNINAFAKEHNLDYSSIYKVVKGKLKSYKGWKGAIIEGEK